MTPQEINEFVARKLGWTQIQRKMRNGHPSDVLEGVRICPGPTCPMFQDIPDYCHSIAAAWEIVEKSGYICRITFGKYYSCELFIAQGERQEFYRAEADTAPMAICLAFLKLESSVVK